MSAETMAFANCAKAAIYIASIIKAVSSCPEIKINCIIDNKSHIVVLYSSKNVEDKMLEFDVVQRENI